MLMDILTEIFDLLVLILAEFVWIALKLVLIAFELLLMRADVTSKSIEIWLLVTLTLAEFV